MCSSSAVIASVAKQSIGQDQLWIASACAASLAMTADLFIVSGHCERSEAIHWTRSALDCFGLRCKPRNDSRFVHRLRSLQHWIASTFQQKSAPRGALLFVCIQNHRG